jgi:hypothetical protein
VLGGSDGVGDHGVGGSGFLVAGFSVGARRQAHRARPLLVRGLLSVRFGQVSAAQSPYGRDRQARYAAVPAARRVAHWPSAGASRTSPAPPAPAPVAGRSLRVPCSGRSRWRAGRWAIPRRDECGTRSRHRERGPPWRRRGADRPGTPQKRPPPALSSAAQAPPPTPAISASGSAAPQSRPSRMISGPFAW